MSHMGAGAFQQCDAPAAPHVTFRQTRALANKSTCKGLADPMPPHSRSVSTEQCREALGDHTFMLIREAMLQQQDTFQSQLWEMHRLTCVQNRKSLEASTEAALGLRSSSSDPSNCIFSRSHQAHMKATARQQIMTLPTLPASLRHSSPDLPAHDRVAVCNTTAQVPSRAGPGVLAGSNSLGQADNGSAGQPSMGTSGFDALLKATPSMPAPVTGAHMAGPLGWGMCVCA